MSDAKTVERAVRAVWDDMRKQRRERRKLASSADLKASADQLRIFAERLDGLALEAKETEAASPPIEIVPTAPKLKQKAKKAAAAKTAKKAKKKK
jgi:hypothetical protein